MQRVFVTVLFLAATGAVSYVYREPLRIFATQVYSQVQPCTMPLTYSLGSIDERFDISRAALLDALERAASTWDDELDRDLLQYAEEGGALTVNLVYDDRQQTTTKLKSLGITISSDKAAYETVQREYQKLLAAYEAEKEQFNAANAALQRDTAAYQAEVARVNARGGATPAEYERLQATKASLIARQDALVARQKRLNDDASDVNAMVQTLNRLASRVNAVASAYNETAEDHQEEFEEAVYQSAPGKQEINVFEFDSNPRLTRVLAHEFGHALGLEHVEESEAIMFRLNQRTDLVITEADRRELFRACRVSA